MSERYLHVSLPATAWQVCHASHYLVMFQITDVEIIKEKVESTYALNL